MQRRTSSFSARCSAPERAALAPPVRELVEPSDAEV